MIKSWFNKANTQKQGIKILLLTFKISFLTWTFPAKTLTTPNRDLNLILTRFSKSALDIVAVSKLTVCWSERKERFRRLKVKKNERRDETRR